jgi:replicative DNA helicase
MTATTGNPHSIPAERAVIASALVDRRTLDLVQLDEADLYHPVHAILWAGLRALQAAWKPTDPLSLLEQLRATGRLSQLAAVSGGRDEADALAYLAALAAEGTTAEAAVHHARTVRALATRRRLEHLGREISARAVAADCEAEELLETVLGEVAGLAQQAMPSEDVAIREVVARTLKAVEARADGEQAIGIPTPFAALDEAIGGWRPKSIVYVAARPGMGKTAFVWQSALDAAEHHGAPVLVFSLEMPSEDLVERGLSVDSGVYGWRLQRGVLENQHWAEFERSSTRIASLPIRLIDTGDLKIARIRAQARRWRARLEPEQQKQQALIVVDYTQLIGADLPGRPTVEQVVAEVSRQLRAMAKELNATVIAVSSLNRDLETTARKNKRPRMSDLRQSGQIEYDADVVLFLYRDEFYDKDSDDKGTAEVIVGKQKHGAFPQTVRLEYQADCTRFRELRTGDQLGLEGAA